MVRNRQGRSNAAMWLVASFVVLATASGSVAGPSCVEGDIGPDSAISVATVQAEGRVPFVKDGTQDPACPSSAAACREAAFLVAGNAVLVGVTSGDYACATYVGAKGGTRTGWLARRALVPNPPSTGLDDWVGTWKTGPEVQIVIGRKGGMLALDGSATWGALDPDRVRRGAVNVGEFSVTVPPKGATASFTQGDDGALPYEAGDDYACRVRLKLAPPFLIVGDNGNCGGANVSFTGLYRR